MRASRPEKQSQQKKSMYGAMDSEAADPQNRRTLCTRRKIYPEYTFQQPAVSRPKTPKGEVEKPSPSEKPKRLGSLKTSESKNKYRDVCEKNQVLGHRLAESDAELVKERTERLLIAENIKVLEQKAAQDLLDEQQRFNAAQAECGDLVTRLNKQILDFSGTISDLTQELKAAGYQLVKERGERLLIAEDIKVLEQKTAQDLLDEQQRFNAAQAECCSTVTLLQKQNLDVGKSYDVTTKNLMASQYQLVRERADSQQRFNAAHAEYGDLVARLNKQILDFSGTIKDLTQELKAARYQLVKERGERLLIAGNIKVLERKATQDLLDMGKNYDLTMKALMATQYKLARERDERLLIAENIKVLEQKAAQDLLDQQERFNAAQADCCSTVTLLQKQNLNVGKSYAITTKALMATQYQLVKERDEHLLIARNHKVLEKKAAQDLLDMGKNYDLTMKTLIATQYKLAREKADSQQKVARDLLRQQRGFDAQRAEHQKTVALLTQRGQGLSEGNGKMAALSVPLASEAPEPEGPVEVAYVSGTGVTTLHPPSPPPSPPPKAILVLMEEEEGSSV